MEMSRKLGLLAMLLALGAQAQVDDDASTEADAAPADAAEQAAERAGEQSRALEEIVVIGGRAGDPQRLDSAYEKALRERILLEIERLKALEEEYEWRRAEPAGEDARIRWGYDPRDEYRARRESELYDLPFDNERPATIFSVRF